MKFRTEIDITPTKDKWLTHRCPVVTLGSCFAAEVGNRLRNELYDVLVNPLGTLFNPCSIEETIDDIVNSKVYTKGDLTQGPDGIWHSFNHHSSFSSRDAELTLDKINNGLALCREYIKQSESAITITLGSARVFTLLSTGKTVTNCHKFDSRLFSVRDLTLDEVVTHLSGSIKKIRILNKEARIILTVSPVRHISYGLHADRLSKSKLLLACDEVINSEQRVDYFPSYEIMHDDLRDYRFYASDMVHPSETAVDYIYGIFKDCYVPEAEEEISREAKAIVNRLRHRFRDETGKDDFNRKTRHMIDNLADRVPGIQKLVEKILKDA